MEVLWVDIRYVKSAFIFFIKQRSIVWDFPQRYCTILTQRAATLPEVKDEKHGQICNMRKRTPATFFSSLKL